MCVGVGVIDGARVGASVICGVGVIDVSGFSDTTGREDAVGVGDADDDELF